MQHRLLVDRRQIAALVLGEEAFVCREQRAQLGVLRRRRKRSLFEIGRFHPRHPQLTNRPPQRLRHGRLIGEVTEVPALLRQPEQQPHDECGTKTFFRWIDAALNQKRSAHARSKIERGDEAQVQPGGAAQRNPLTKREPDVMRGDDDPLRARGVRATQSRQLIDEGIRHRFSLTVRELGARWNDERTPRFGKARGSRPGDLVYHILGIQALGFCGTLLWSHSMGEA